MLDLPGNISPEEYTQAVLDSTVEGIWTIGLDGLIKTINKSAVRMFGYDSPDQMIGRNSHDLVHYKKVDGTHYSIVGCPIYLAFQEGRPVHLEDEVLWKADGTPIYADYRSVPILKDGQILGAVVTFVDNTEKRLQHRHLIESRESYKIQATELSHAIREAEHANSLKSAFLANMSHEIRTPLGAIMGFADLLRERNLDVATREQFLETISRNSKALTRIIDDILDLAKVESGKLDVETLEFSFKELINDVIDLFRENVRAKGIAIHAEIDPRVPARISSDPTRLRQILINIVGNAVKFTDKGSVTVIARAVHDENDRFFFSIFVKDTGVGISEEQRQNLFQPFMQADNTTTRKFGGTGLGLALSRRLANALGGDISITESEIGAGCTFSITFEAGIARQKTVLVPFGKMSGVDREMMPLADLRILIADDSPDNRFLITRILHKNGATVEIATNGLEAYRLAMDGQYDLILMDIQMPEMDGYAATRNLREAGFKKPILALTAHAMAEERARSMAAGCNGHLTKPLSTPLLIQTIRSHATV